MEHSAFCSAYVQAVCIVSWCDAPPTYLLPACSDCPPPTHASNSHARGLRHACMDGCLHAPAPLAALPGPVQLCLWRWSGGGCLRGGTRCVWGGGGGGAPPRPSPPRPEMGQRDARALLDAWFPIHPSVQIVLACIPLAHTICACMLKRWRIYRIRASCWHAHAALRMLLLLLRRRRRLLLLLRSFGGCCRPALLLQQTTWFTGTAGCAQRELQPDPAASQATAQSVPPHPPLPPREPLSKMTCSRQPCTAGAWVHVVPATQAACCMHPGRAAALFCMRPAPMEPHPGACSIGHPGIWIQLAGTRERTAM